jgi:hypothetical protein
MTPPMTNDLIERLRERADHYGRRAEVMARYADTVPSSDPYRAVADGDADSDHSHAATMQQAAAHIEAQAERVRELEGALDVIKDVWSLPPIEPLANRKWHCQHEEWLASACHVARQARKDKENG